MSESDPPPPDSISNARPAKLRELAFEWTQFIQMRKLFSKYGGYWLTIGQARHFNFSDYAFSSPLRIYSLSGPIAPANAARIISQYMLAFFDQYLKGIDQPLLDDRSPHSSEVRFERSKPDG
jgi:hypothetical protein